MRINQTQHAILGCLTIKPMTAYEVKTFLHRFTGFFWKEQEGQLYPTFNKLVEGGYVEFEQVTAQKKGEKKIYAITEIGKKHFKDWYESKSKIPVDRNPFLLKLFFGRSQNKRKCIEMLESYLADLQETKSIFQMIGKMLLEKGKNKINVEFYQYTLNYGASINKAEISWCKSTLNSLRGDK